MFVTETFVTYLILCGLTVEQMVMCRWRGEGRERVRGGEKERGGGGERVGKIEREYEI